MISLDNNQIAIMGRPNFSCAGIAKLLIAAGVYEDKAKKAEYEQAVFIHWALQLFNEHGDGWAREAEKVIKECRKLISDSQ